MKILFFTFCLFLLPFIVQANTNSKYEVLPINTSETKVSKIENSTNINSLSLLSITYKITKVKDCTVSMTIQYGTRSPLTVTFTASTCEQAINAAKNYVSTLPSIQG